MSMYGKNHYHIVKNKPPIRINKLLKKKNKQQIKIVLSGPITSWQIDGEKWKQKQILFSWAPKSLQMVTKAMNLKDACFLKEKL